MLLLLVLCYSSKAQLNESDTMRLQLRAGININRQTGNIDVFILRTRLESVIKFPGSLVFKTQNNSLYQAFNERKADNDMNSRNYIYYKPHRRWYPFIMAYVQQNYRLKVDQRFFAGPGLTWQMIRHQGQHLKLSASIVYENTNYTTGTFNEAYYSGNTSVELWRPTFYVSGSHQVIEHVMKVHYQAYWQPGLSPVSNQRFQAETGLEVNIAKGFAFTLQYLFIREELVPLLIKQNDALLTAGINYQLTK